MGIITSGDLFQYFPFAVLTVPIGSMIAVVLGLKFIHFGLSSIRRLFSS